MPHEDAGLGDIARAALGRNRGGLGRPGLDIFGLLSVIREGVAKVLFTRGRNPPVYF
jgi:hypothetical protein